MSAALEFVGEANSFGDLEAFRAGILPGIQRLVPSDLVGYNEVDLSGGPALVVTHPDPLPATGEALARLAHEHPLISVQMNGDGRTYKISDFLSAGEFHSLELYDEIYSPLGAEDQIAFGLPGPVVIGIGDEPPPARLLRARPLDAGPAPPPPRARLRQPPRVAAERRAGLGAGERARHARRRGRPGRARRPDPHRQQPRHGADRRLPPGRLGGSSPTRAGEPFTVESEARQTDGLGDAGGRREGLLLVLEEEPAVTVEALLGAGLTPGAKRRCFAC